MKKKVSLIFSLVLLATFTTTFAAQIDHKTTQHSKYSIVSAPDNAYFGQSTTCTFKTATSDPRGYTPIYVTDEVEGRTASNTCHARNVGATAQLDEVIAHKHNHRFSDYAE